MIAPQFDDADQFSEGFACIAIGEKFGYINQTGTVTIRPQFEVSGRFRIKPKFDHALRFHNGSAIVVDINGVGGGIAAPGISISDVSGRWGYISRRGRYIWQSSDLSYESETELSIHGKSR